MDGDNILSVKSQILILHEVKLLQYNESHQHQYYSYEKLDANQSFDKPSFLAGLSSAFESKQRID